VSLATPEKIRRLQRALYVKAKQEPMRRFHCLYDKVWREDILAHAYVCCRANGGAPGVDGETFARIDAHGVKRWLGALREEVQTRRYKPQPVRRVMIPKSSGVGQRPLGIPTIRDRVVQTAATLVLAPIFEADFDEAAFGYRRNAVRSMRFGKSTPLSKRDIPKCSTPICPNTSIRSRTQHSCGASRAVSVTGTCYIC
jgi:RNA-directed DNA polymerase